MTKLHLDLEPGQPLESTTLQKLVQTVDDLSITGLSADKAISVILEAAGIHHEWAPRKTSTGGVRYFLRFFPDVYTVADSENLDDLWRMGVPKRLDMPREGPFTSHNDRSIATIAARNAAQAATLTTDRRAVNAVTVIGGPQEYEVTLLLRPGWSPTALLDNRTTTEEIAAAKSFWSGEFTPEFESTTRKPRSVYHSGHPNHAPYASVGRLWVFPDSVEYMTAELGRSGYPDWFYSPYHPTVTGALMLAHPTLGGGIDLDETRGWSPRRRPPMDTIGRLSRSVATRNPIVRVNFNAPDPAVALSSPGWVTYSGDCRIDEDRLAIWFRDANLWRHLPVVKTPDAPTGNSFNMLQAIIDQKFAVSITCTIRGDTRIKSTASTTEGTSYARPRTLTIDTKFDRFQYRNRRGQNSHLNDQDDDAIEYEDRDDRPALERYAELLLRRASAEVTAGNVEVFFLTNRYRPGDFFTGISGLGVDFPAFASIKQATGTITEISARTKLTLTDRRHDPELGSES